jgi:hypothetical protein
MKFRLLAAGVAVATVFVAGCASGPEEKPTPVFDPGPSVTIAEPFNGQTVKSPFKVRFVVSGMTIGKVGDMTPNSGHHHLLINKDSIPAQVVIPTDEEHIHFGQGQTEAMVTLKPGTYRLTAQFANGSHQSYGQALSHTITVTVAP